ncbi:MAG: AI-2E family transporter [Paraprevotella sp.]|nr:AI-2E family transporter [Paraprevotella sp.]
MFEKEITFDRFIRGLWVVAGLAVAIYVINLLSAVLLPFFIAWLLAYMIYPGVKFFQYKLHLHNRILCIVITLLIIGAAIVCFFYLIIPPAIAEFMKFRTIIVEFIRDTGKSATAHEIEVFLRQYIDQNSIVRLLHENNVMEALKTAINQIQNLVAHTFDFIMTLLGFCMVLLYLFFILLDYEKLSEGWIRLVPKRSRRFASVLMSDVQHGMNSYFRGQALVAFLVGILFSIGFLIIDFPLAIGLGLFIGFLNLVPYMQALGFIPTILLALLKAYDTGVNFWSILLSACIVFIVVQSIQDAFLVPKIMGKLMGLNPAVILLSLSVWGSFLGIIGLIIALPLTTLLLSYYRRFIERDERRITVAEERRRKQWAEERQMSASTETSASAISEGSEVSPVSPQATAAPEIARQEEKQP